MTPESKLKKQVFDFLDSQIKEGHPLIYFRRQASVASGYSNGLPDCYGIYNSTHFEIEFKRSDNKGIVSSDQLIWMRRFKRLNVPYILVDSFDSFHLWYVSNFLKG